MCTTLPHAPLEPQTCTFRESGQWQLVTMWTWPLPSWLSGQCPASSKHEGALPQQLSSVAVGLGAYSYVRHPCQALALCPKVRPRSLSCCNHPPAPAGASPAHLMCCSCCVSSDGHTGDASWVDTGAANQACLCCSRSSATVSWSRDRIDGQLTAFHVNVGLSQVACPLSQLVVFKTVPTCRR